MKVIIILSLLLLTSTAFGELTKEDIRTIVREEITASEKRTREYIDLKIDGVEKSLNAKIDGLEKSVDARFNAVDTRFNAVNTRFNAVDKKLDWVWYMMIALIGLVTAALAVPQIIVAYRDRGRQEMQTQQQQMQLQIDQLREKIEGMQQ